LEGLQLCSGCHQRQYCSPECQKKAWAEHKVICKTWQFVGRDVTSLREVVRLLHKHGNRLGDLNLRESELNVAMEVLAFCKASNADSDLTLTAIFNISITLEAMSRYPEAETFAREMIAETEKLLPVDRMHAMAARKLSKVLVFQARYEEAWGVAHDAMERFRPILRDMEAMVCLMEAESVALYYLERYEEALALQQDNFSC
jgi:tetratricopeptide (TPR) repeat protein